MSRQFVQLADFLDNLPGKFNLPAPLPAGPLVAGHNHFFRTNWKKMGRRKKIMRR